MSKKAAILIIIGVEVLVYLFLLTGLPVIESRMIECSTCGYTEEYAAPKVLYLIPGLIGAFLILMIKIAGKKKEVKGNG